MGRKSNATERLTKAAIEMIWSVGYGDITIDALCERAQVNKGSFYYFFDSKPHLVTAAIGGWWEERRCLLEKSFRPEVPPMERIFNYITAVAQSQIQGYETHGLIRGAPIFRLGSEIAMHHEPLQLLITQIINCHICCFEEAIKEAQGCSQDGAGDAALKAQFIWGFYVSMLTRAHIEQNPERLRNVGSEVRKLIDSQFFTLALDSRKRSGTDFKAPAAIDSEVKPKGTEASGDKMEDIAKPAKRKPHKKRSKS